MLLHGREISSLTVREDHRLRVSANKFPSRMSGPKKEEGIGRGRELCNEKLNKLYSPPDG
jgi:hypothetical protein